MPKKPKKEIDESQILRDTFAREQQTVTKFLAECKSDLEKTMSVEKMPELHRKLDEFWKDIHQIIDRKMNYIKILSAEYDHTKEQYQRRAYRHCELIEYFLNAYDLFAKRLEMSYESDCLKLITQHRVEKDFRMNYNQKIMENYENIHDGIKLLTDNKLKEIENKFLANKTQLERDSIIRQENYRDVADNFKNNLSEQMENILDAMRRNYGLNEIEEKYKKLVKKDNIASDDILKLEADIELKQSLVLKIEKEINDVESKASRAMSALTTEKHQLYEHLQKLKCKIKVMEEAHDKQLKCLVVTAHEATKLLNERANYGEHFLALLSACRSHQTEAEKIQMPESLSSSEPDTEDTTGILKESVILSQLVAQIDEQNLELNEEKMELQRENSKLRADIKKYCDKQKYNAAIAKLNISTAPTVGVPNQEASHMSQILNKLKKSANNC